MECPNCDENEDRMTLVSLGCLHHDGKIRLRLYIKYESRAGVQISEIASLCYYSFGKYNYFSCDSLLSEENASMCEGDIYIYNLHTNISDCECNGSFSNDTFNV